MVKVCGIPMIGHVYHRCKMAPELDDLWVATCDKEIFDYIHAIGGKAIMTADTHERATDRCAEAMLKIEQAEGSKADTLVMIQGDEPMIHPEMISQLVGPMVVDKSIIVANLIEEIATEEKFVDPNQVKVVLDKLGNALYFSREPIPSRKKFSGTIPMYKQLGIIAFQRDFIIRFNEMDQTPLEIIESVDMMRILENGLKIRMIPTPHRTQAIDTPADLALVESLMGNDSLIRKYERK